ncbi:hypothetical protein ACIBJI_17335 [Nocardia sp. NPDC050408]|uniref:hypothetical protein n=1 Tax=unclassified Nocardia TaxID=2637762 RepID=UPI00342D8B16
MIVETIPMWTDQQMPHGCRHLCALMSATALIEPVGAVQATCKWLYRSEADRTHRAMTMTVQRPLLED